MTNWADFVGGASGVAASAFPTVGNSSGTSNSSSSTQSDATTTQQQQSFIDSILKSISQLTSSSSTTPNLSPEHQALINSLMAKYGQLTNKPVDMSGYATQQTQGFNRNSTLQKQAADNIMAARGVSGSPAAAVTDTNIDAQRMAQINNMQMGIPVLQNQMMQQNLAGATALAGVIPHGTTNTGFQTQTGNQSGSQSANQSGYGTQTSLVNATGQTNQTAKNSSGGGWGGLLGGIGSMLPLLLGG